MSSFLSSFEVLFKAEFEKKNSVENHSVGIKYSSSVAVFPLFGAYNAPNFFYSFDGLHRHCHG